MAANPSFASPVPPARNWSGWIVLALLFALIIPSTIIESFQGTDAKSKDPVVQAGNLEAVVEQESPEDHQTKKLQAVANSMAPKHVSNEDASAVYAAANAELHAKLSGADLAPLANSKVAARRTVAELYADPPPPPARARTLAASLPIDRYLYKLAKAQTLERLGDKSVRRLVSPELDAAASRTKLVVINLLIAMALLGGCAVLLVYGAALASGALKWRGHPLEPGSSADADALAIRAAQLFGVFLLVELGVALAAAGIPGSRTPAGSLLAEVVASSAVILGTVLITRTPVGGTWVRPIAGGQPAQAAVRWYRLADYGLTKQAILPSLVWGLGGLFAVVPLATVGAYLGSLIEHVAPRADHPLLHMLEDPHNLWFLAGALFLASVQAPFTEELLFRGTLTPALSGLFRGRRYPVPLAIGLSSLIFASIHPQGFTLWLPLASVGVVNGVLCYQTRSVLPGIFMHAMFNAAAVGITLLIR